MVETEAELKAAETKLWRFSLGKTRMDQEESEDQIIVDTVEINAEK